ncbi:MAG TPA: ABC transporter permease [Solirubrobacteraceae bacterium]|nr:ABC transporter permease [Solirubrobacteraceae bacterium]
MIRARRLLRGPWARTEHLLPVASFVVILVAFLVVPGLEGDPLNSGAWFNGFQGFAPLGLVALALGLTLIAGEFDVSVLGMQALGGVLAVRAGGHSGLLGVLAAVAGCGFLGLVQGGLIARLRLPSLPVTIGSYVALIGLTNVLANDQTLTYGNLNASVWVDNTLFGWFSPRSLITFAAFALAIALIGCTKLGPELKALGAERRGARVSGVPVERRITLLFVISAALAGLAGALLSYSEASATLDPGLQPLILAVAAAVLGGVSLSGGRGVVWGLLLGSVAVALLEQLFTIISLSAATTQILFGALLLVIVSVDAPDLKTSLRATGQRLAQRAKPRSETV